MVRADPEGRRMLAAIDDCDGEPIPLFCPPFCAGAGSGRAAAVTATTTIEEPHSPQNFCDSAFIAPHFWQRTALCVDVRVLAGPSICASAAESARENSSAFE